MESALLWWQHLPQSIDQRAFVIGSLPVYWYALFFLFGAFIVYWLAGKEYVRLQIFSQKEFNDFSFWALVSILAGGKLGFLLLYWWPFAESFLPQARGIGMPGMSFAGGMLAVAFYIWWYACKYQKNFFTLTDILAPFIPIALFFGRLGSFVHGELPGRITERAWGMYASGESVLRHPSTLYAAFLEGLLLFSILFFLRKQHDAGVATAFFCIGYGILRFMGEFFREPDRQIGYIGIFTFNHLIAAFILIIGLVLLATRKRKNTV